MFPGLVPSEADGLVIIGVSLDNSREDFETYIKAHHTDWVHTFSGKGWDDPTARKYDIHHLPSAWLIDRQVVLRYTNDGRYHHGISTLQREMDNALAQGRGPSTPQPEARNVKVALQWHVIGPFEVGTAARARSARAEEGKDAEGSTTAPVRAATSPAPGEKADPQAAYKGKDGRTVRWRAIEAKSRGTLYFGSTYRNVSFFEAHAKVYVHSSNGGTYQVNFGGSDFMVVYVNGERVYDSLDLETQRYSHNRYTAELSLKKGSNEVHLTMGHIRGGRSFYMRFTDPDDTLKFATEPK